jgi:hypothetical protein
MTLQNAPQRRPSIRPSIGPQSILIEGLPGFEWVREAAPKGRPSIAQGGVGGLRAAAQTPEKFEGFCASRRCSVGPQLFLRIQWKI